MNIVNNQFRKTTFVEAVFTMDEAGLMYEASIVGQKFVYQDRKI